MTELEHLAIRLADTAFADGADCTCAPGDECVLCEAFRVLGPSARPEWRAATVRCFECGREATHTDAVKCENGYDAGPCCGSAGCCVMVDYPNLREWYRKPLVKP